MLSLKNINLSKSIYIRIFSANPFLIGTKEKFLFGSKEMILYQMLDKDLSIIIISSLNFLLGLTSITLVIFYKEKIFIHFGLLSIFFGAYTFNLNTKQLYFCYPILSALIWEFSTYIVFFMIYKILEYLNIQSKLFQYFFWILLIFIQLKFLFV